MHMMVMVIVPGRRFLRFGGFLLGLCFLLERSKTGGLRFGLR
jgi:hypothetical protein